MVDAPRGTNPGFFFPLHWLSLHSTPFFLKCPLFSLYTSYILVVLLLFCFLSVRQLVRSLVLLIVVFIYGKGLLVQSFLSLFLTSLSFTYFITCLSAV